MSILLSVIKFAAIGAIGTLAAAVGLAFSQSPKVPSGGDGLDFSNTLERDATTPQPLEQYVTRNGSKLDLRSYESQTPNAPLLILLHGSGWHGLQFDTLARRLASGGHADVLAPDLRGHGVNPERRGDIDYIGQFEDDIADLIKQRARPDQPVVLAGHSSGGGLVIRFAGGTYGSLLTKAILMAPFLKYDAPTMQPNSGGWAHTALRRLIGLSMLNGVGITALNHLNVIAFNMPTAVMSGALAATATTQYSYRLNTSYAPRSNYLADVGNLPPFLLLAGSKDEAFVASEFEATLSSANDQGTYHLIPDVGHLDIVDEEATFQSIVEFLKP